MLQHFDACFNPCFNGTTSATVWWEHAEGTAPIGVSILVLMELPLQLEEAMINATLKKRFNPCFNGTTSATYPHYTITKETN